MSDKEIVIKNKLVGEIQKILPILSLAEVEEYWGMLEPVDGEPKPERFAPTKREMIDIIAWRLFKCTPSQIETYLNEIKQAAETRLKRKHDIMQALSDDSELSDVQTDVPVPTDTESWLNRLALLFADRYGCLAIKLAPNGEYGEDVDEYEEDVDEYEEDDGEDEDETCESEQMRENFGFCGTYVFASACGKHFAKACFFAKRQCEKIAADAKKSGICEDGIEAIYEAYGYGFYNGVSETFAAQWRDEMKQGLCLVVPQAIGDFKELAEEDSDFVMYPDLGIGEYGLFYMEGVRDGRKSALSNHS